ncbi:lactonase family protein [Devosia sp.]|uniref:lactonase family protein n=1 Tax=Devosia sp. TaxID=1871048 RepID=UPI003A8E175B
MAKTTLLSGSYTGEGLAVLTLDTQTGSLEHLRSFPETPDASWVVFNPATRTVYITDEMAGRVGAFRLSEDATELTPLGYRSTGAKYPCYLALSPDGKHLAVGNYGDDSVPVFPLADDGSLGEPQVLHGTQPAETGHAHWAQWTPEGDSLHVVDLGHDEVRAYAWDAATASFGPPKTVYGAPKGAGPRHLAFHPNGKHAYIFTEYAETLAALRRDPDGDLVEIETLSALPVSFNGESTGAHIQLNPAGTVAYVSNRGHNSISVFAIADDGGISLQQVVDCGGNWPRFFLLIGDHLIVANQESEDLICFSVDSDGTLNQSGAPFPLPKPVCLLPI